MRKRTVKCDEQQRQFDKLWRDSTLNTESSKALAEYWYFVGRRDEFIYRDSLFEKSRTIYPRLVASVARRLPR